ncbi:MAG TPA: hypothetical protein VMH50_16865 [Thermoleophilia bacterium]|nr:hypothetical protein [Thermoleophilia bacterium]
MLSTPFLTRGLWAAVLVTVLGVLAVLVAPVAASAAPLDPILPLAQLRALLDESGTGTVDGYFKTVVQGTTIVDIPCEITGIAPGQAADGGPLITFNASGPVIAAIGGIAEGMSGSPMYVSDAGTDKLIGAVSYGVEGAGGGFGMATPIERMMSAETAAAPELSVRTLTQPVRADGQLIRRVVVASSRTAARTVEPRADTVCVVPLAELQISGIPASTTMFRTLQHLLADEGIDVRSTMLAAPSGAGGVSGASPDLVPGASVAAMLTRGDPLGPDYLDDSVYYYGVGGVGTVTYRTAAGGLVAWGHPFFASGRCSLYLNDAEVLQTVPSVYDPFKLAVPGLVPRGTFTEDGLTAIAGTTDAVPTEVPISVHAVSSDTGKTVDSTSYVTSWVASQRQFAGLVPAAIWPALWQAGGDPQFDGTISYSAQIQLRDGSGEYTVTKSGIWDSVNDAGTVLYLDLALDMMRLTADPDGVASPTIESVSVNAALSHAHNRARIADVSVAGGLKVGDNRVTVTLWPYGSASDRTVEVPLKIAPGTLLSGTLYVTAPYLGIDDLGGGWIGYEVPNSDNAPQRQTLGKIVDAINAQPAMDEVQVAYDPQDDDSYSDWDSQWGDQATLAGADTGTFLIGSKSKQTVRLSLGAQPPRVRRRGNVLLHGTLSRAAGETTVALYLRRMGSKTFRLLDAAVPVTALKIPHGPTTYTFTYPVRHLRWSATVKAVWGGDHNYLGATGRCQVRLRKH